MLGWLCVVCISKITCVYCLGNQQQPAISGFLSPDVPFSWTLRGSDGTHVSPEKQPLHLCGQKSRQEGLASNNIYCGMLQGNFLKGKQYFKSTL